MSIASNIRDLKLPSAVKLVAVSKFKPAEAILEAYKSGQRVFGESRPQEFKAKAEVLPKDIEWHFIGHLQTNKIKMVLPFASMIESIDTEHLLTALNKEAEESGKCIDTLLEVHIASESTKQGFSPEEAVELLRRHVQFSAIRFRGLMGMASFVDDISVIRREFRTLKSLFDSIDWIDGFDTLSMGMSEDYQIAVEEGTNLVRIGTAIFGNR